MYLFKQNIEIDLKQKQIAEIIGVSESFLSKVLNRKRQCSKILAYAITKTLNSEKEIKDYFERIN